MVRPRGTCDSFRCAARALAPLCPPVRDTANARVTASTDRAARTLFATVALDLIHNDPLQLGAAAGCAPQQKWLVQTMRTGLCPRFPTPGGRNASSLTKTKCFVQAPAKGAAGCPAGSCVLRCCLMPVPRPRAPFLPPSPPGVRTWYLSHLSRLPYPLRHRPKTDDCRHCACMINHLTGGPPAFRFPCSQKSKLLATPTEEFNFT